MADVTRKQADGSDAEDVSGSAAMDPGPSVDRERPTMRQVAELAGVSAQTVSNLVNGRGHQMGLDTRAKVLRAMKELGYHPDQAARSLRSGRLQTIGFLVLDVHPHFLADPLTDSMLAGAGDVTRDRGYALLIQAAKPADPPDALLAPLLERRADGACVLLSGPPGRRREVRKRLTDLGFPFVVFDEATKPPAGVSVRAANTSGARQLTEHLLADGHQRVAFIAASAPWPVIEQRFRGYKLALRSKGIEFDPALALFEGGLDTGGGADMATKLLELPDPPTAIMASSDLLAIGAMQTVRRAGYSVPGEVAITGYDDFAFAEFVEPSLTTVRVPGYEMGRRAMELLIGWVDGGRPAQWSVEFPVELCLRDSA